NKEEAKGHYQNLTQERYTVSEIKKEEVVKRPAPPFITSTLQQDASRRFRIATSRIMRIAQQLYEGIDLGSKGNVGLITYMRTDSTRISSAALGSVRTYIAGSYGTDFLPQKANFYKGKKSAQDAHEAIRPSYISAEFEPRKLKKFLSADQLKIYELIWKRFVASQMKPAIAEKTTIDILAGKYLFRVSGEIITFRGFLQAYQPDEDSNGEEDKGPQGIPRYISKGEILKLLDILLNQMFTKPPPRYTESTLVKTLDKLGIGRPSTYAQIISTIFNRQYIEREERALKPTELGRIVSRLLSN
ncbi:MAG: DNA topoisomerase I, partial [Aliifodinibius sp.]|nr:DNA topoisomerase I [Fodinibius sp.]NIV09995.1 DNA topoisomerase I [Fodinibius sp.]NIY23552.1 DNA topoisomerase I [Fodinibius sp.]